MTGHYEKAVLCDTGPTLSFSCSDRELLDGLMDCFRRNPRNRVEEWSAEIEGRVVIGFTVDCNVGWFGDVNPSGFVDHYLRASGWLPYSETATPLCSPNGGGFHTHRSYYRRHLGLDEI
jgi:hypothetical protein